MLTHVQKDAGQVAALGTVFQNVREENVGVIVVAEAAVLVAIQKSAVLRGVAMIPQSAFEIVLARSAATMVVEVPAVPVAMVRIVMTKAIVFATKRDAV